MASVNKYYDFPSSTQDTTYTITLQPDTNTTATGIKPITITQNVTKMATIDFSVKSSNFPTISFTSGYNRSQSITGTVGNSTPSIQTIQWSILQPSAGAWVKKRDVTSADFKTVTGGKNNIDFINISTTIDSSSPNPLVIVANINVNQFVADETIILNIDDIVGVETDLTFNYVVASGSNFTYSSSDNVVMTGQSGDYISILSTYKPALEFKLTPSSGYTFPKITDPATYLKDNFELVSGGAVVTDSYVDTFTYALDATGNMLVGYVLKPNIVIPSADATISLQRKSSSSFNTSSSVSSSTDLSIIFVDSSGNPVVGIDAPNYNIPPYEIYSNNVPVTINSAFSQPSIGLGTYVDNDYTFYSVSAPSVSINSSAGVGSTSQSISIDASGDLILSIAFTPSAVNSAIQYKIVATPPIRKYLPLLVGDNYNDFNSANGDLVIDSQTYYINVDPKDLKINDKIFLTIDSTSTSGLTTPSDGYVGTKLNGIDYILTITGGTVTGIDPRTQAVSLNPPSLSGGLTVQNNTMTSFDLEFNIDAFGATVPGATAYVVYTSLYGDSTNSFSTEALKREEMAVTRPSIIDPNDLSSLTSTSGKSDTVQNTYEVLDPSINGSVRSGLSLGTNTIANIKKPKFDTLNTPNGNRKLNSQGQSVPWQPEIYARLYVANSDGNWMWSDQIKIPEVLGKAVIAQSPGAPQSVSSLAHSDISIEFGDYDTVSGTYSAIINAKLTKALPGDNTYLGLVLSEDDTNYPVTAVTPTSYPWKDPNFVTNHNIWIWNNDGYNLAEAKFKISTFPGLNGKKVIDKGSPRFTSGSKPNGNFTSDVPNSSYNEFNQYLHIGSGLKPGQKYNYQLFAFRSKIPAYVTLGTSRRSEKNYMRKFVSGATYSYSSFNFSQFPGMGTSGAATYKLPNPLTGKYINSVYGPIEDAEITSEPNGNGDFTVPTLQQPMLTMSVGTPEINYAPVTLSISQRGSAGGAWRESGIIISENSTLKNPRNAAKVRFGGVTGTVHKDYKKIPIDTSIDTYKIPFWTTDVTNSTAFNSVTTQTTNWPYIDGINPSGTNFVPNASNDPSGGLKPLTKYYANWYVIDSNGDYHVGSVPVSFKTKKDLIYKHDDLYMDSDTMFSQSGAVMPRVCCPNINSLLPNKTTFTDDPSLDSSTQVVKYATTNSSGVTQVVSDPNATFFRTATGNGYYKWDGNQLSSGQCSSCPTSSGTPNGNALTAVGTGSRAIKNSGNGLYQPCTVWDTNLSDQANLDKIGNDGWRKNNLFAIYDKACIWVKLKDTNTQAYPVGTTLIVEDPNDTTKTLTVKVGVPNIDISGNYSSSGSNTAASVKKPATKLVPLIDEKSSMAMQFIPRSYGGEYTGGQFASGPIDKMPKILDNSRDEWTPQRMFSKTRWDIQAISGTNMSSADYSLRARDEYQRFGSGDNDYDLWDYMEEFSWYVVNDSSVLTSSSNIYNDDISKNQIWIGSSQISNPWSSSDRQGDFRMKIIDYSGYSGGSNWQNSMGSGFSINNVQQTLAQMSNLPYVTYNKHWFYNHRPSGVISTFRRPYKGRDKTQLITSAQYQNTTWQFPDSPSDWSKNNYAAATEVLNQANFNQARHVQLAMNAKGVGSGSMQAAFQQWNYTYRLHWNNILNSGEVFSSLYGSGYTPTGLTGTLTNSGWSNRGARGTQLNSVLFDVPENAGPLYLAKFTQTKDGYPSRKVFDRGSFGGSGDSKFWQGNAFWDHQNKFWFTVCKNLWSGWELQSDYQTGSVKNSTSSLEQTFQEQKVGWREKS